MKANQTKLAALLLALITILNLAAVTAMAAPPSLDAQTNLAVKVRTERDGYQSVVNMASGNPAWANASEWAVPELEKAYNAALIPRTLLGADMTKYVTRAEFAALAVQLYENLTGKEALPAPSDTFSDTSLDFVLKAYLLGIVNGVGDGKFNPYGNATREQIAAMLGRTVEKAAGISTALDSGGYGTPDFPDKSEVSAYAQTYMNYMLSYRFILGVDGKILPKGICTREQAIIMAYRVFEHFSGNINGGSTVSPGSPYITEFEPAETDQEKWLFMFYYDIPAEAQKILDNSEPGDLTLWLDWRIDGGKWASESDYKTNGDIFPYFTTDIDGYYVTGYVGKDKDPNLWEKTYEFRMRFVYYPPKGGEITAPYSNIVKAGGRSANARTDSYAGLWHGSPVLGSGWAERLLLEENGIFYWAESQYDETSRTRFKTGAWSIEGNTLTLSVTDYLYRDNGKVTWEILHRVPKIETYSLDGLWYDAETYKNTALIGGEQFWLYSGAQDFKDIKDDYDAMWKLAE
ncbi:MAG: S-layer homology domain-containing protein [Oscillospiraceae bacterium]|jgi:hypothetical protein|nr:S-layer homology domain-containing protein [Oscillospiraceae bacterium]